MMGELQILSINVYYINQQNMVEYLLLELCPTQVPSKKHFKRGPEDTRYTQSTTFIKTLFNLQKAK